MAYRKHIRYHPGPPPLPRPTLGARVSVAPYIGDQSPTYCPGTIISINDAHKHYTVLLDMGFRQTFQWGTTK